MSDTCHTRSTCPYCGVGCGLIIETQQGQITGVRGDPEHPANWGRLCAKGATLHLTAQAEVTHQARLLHPMRRERRGQPPTRTSWDQALEQASATLARIVHAHGPEALGFYVSGQLLTEDYYVFNKLVKGLIGSPHLDSNSRLCMSSAVAGYKQSLGVDAPPTCYDDLQHAHTIFIAGANPAFAHPVLHRRIEDAKRSRPELQIVVCDPRRTDSTEIADLHLALQPGTDVMLFNGMLHVMLWEGWVDTRFIAAHTQGFDALKASVRECTPEQVAQVCGIARADLLQAARLFAQSSATLSLYCQGLNQSSSGSAKNVALINLHLATGHIGKPGAGPFSLTGQPNAMGGREVGGMANLLSAHRELSNPAHRAEVAALWGVPELPSRPGKTAIEMFQAAADGEIKALWIACTNPAQSLPDQNTVRRALERAELVVVQEAFAHTATCAFADLLLPASSWGEKEGTVTNSERRISRVRAAVPAPGEARPDWQIACELAQRLQPLLGRTQPRFDYAGPEAIWLEHRESTRGRDLDITGLSYAMLEQQPEQWPCPTGQRNGTARLYLDGRFPTPDGRARLLPVPYRPLAEPRDARYPFSLSTGRLRDQWHGMSRTGTLGRLYSHAPEPALQMHPQDMARQQLQEGDLVHLTSRRASIVLPLQACADLGRNQVFLAMHWGEESLSGQNAQGQRLAGVNAVTTSVFCPDAKQPELKHSAVKVLKAELPHRLVAMAWVPARHLLDTRRQLQALMAQFDYASCTLFGQAAAPDAPGPAQQGLLLRAAAHEPVAPELLRRIETLLELDAPSVLRFSDPRRGQHRAMRLVAQAGLQLLDAFLLVGDTRALDWIMPLLQHRLPAPQPGRSLLRPGASPPTALAPPSPTVCGCLNVTQEAIESQLRQQVGPVDAPFDAPFDAHSVAKSDARPEVQLAALQAALRCGTQCGACLPQLRRLVRAATGPGQPAAATS